MATWNGSPVEETVSAVQEESGPLKVESEFPWIQEHEVRAQEENHKSGVENIDETQLRTIRESSNSLDSQSTLVAQDDHDIELVEVHDDRNNLHIDHTEQNYLRGIHTQDDAPDNHVASLHENLRNSASTDVSSSFERMSLLSFGQRSSSSVDYCDECQALDKEVACPESRIFWHEIPCKGLTPTGCHVKLWSAFNNKLSDWYPDNDALKSKTTVAMLKSLLDIDLSDASATIEYRRLVEIMKFFGPLRKNDGVMLNQIYHVARNSLKKKDARRRKTEQISWFAGKMTRTEAMKRLDAEKERTYLIRMSETREASFVISVKDDDVIEHFEIPQDYRAVANTSPFNAQLSLNNRTYSNLVDAVNSLTSHPPKDENGDEVWCMHICPGLPLNGVITGYKKT